MDIVTDKICKKCGNRGDFKKGRNICKKCDYKYNKEWYGNNKEKMKAYKDKYISKKAKELGHAFKKWYSNNSDYMRQWRKDYYIKNSDKIKQKSKEYYSKNKKEIRSRFLALREEKPELIKERTSRWRKNNRLKSLEIKHARRARIKGNGGRYTAAEWRDLCDRYGNKCLACGVTGVRLSVDHVIPISKGGSNSIDNLQPLCKSCNSSKGTKYIDYRY